MKTLRKNLLAAAVIAGLGLSAVAVASPWGGHGRMGGDCPMMGGGGDGPMMGGQRGGGPGARHAMMQQYHAERMELLAARLKLKPEQEAAWKGFLASFYGGINEEILLRLCVMSFLVWLGRFVSKTTAGGPTLTVLWIANILAALLFGLGHLPATSALVPLTPLVVTRALVLNGLIGVGFGYLYFKHGLESAMISHFSADLVLHVLFAL